MGASEAELMAALAGVWERRREEIVGRVDVLDDAVAAVDSRMLTEPLRDAAERAAHQLTGTAGTFGFDRASELARVLEHALAGENRLGPADAAWMRQNVIALRNELDRPAPGPPATESAGAPVAPTVLLITDDPELIERLTPELEARGQRVAAAATDSVSTEIAARRPYVAVVDLEEPGDVAAGLDLVERLASADPPLPVIVLTERHELTDRVDVARRGGRAIVARSLPADAVADAVWTSIEPLVAEEPRILALDDDPAMLESLQHILADERIALTTAADADSFWRRLREEPVDLVMLDVQMPEVDGLELCRIIRGDARYSSLPVLFLTAGDDPATLQQVFEAGADDFVAKPIVAPVLLTRIRNRLDRVRLYRELAERDPLTGVANRRRWESEMARLERLATRHDQPLSIALLDLDHFKQVNDRFGHGVGDSVLRAMGQLLQRRFRGEDVVARLGGEEFVIGMYGMAVDDGVDRVARLLEETRNLRLAGEGPGPDTVTFTAAVAQRGINGADLDEIYRAADVALYAAKAAGRDRVVRAAPAPAQAW